MKVSKLLVWFVVGAVAMFVVYVLVLVIAMNTGSDEKRNNLEMEDDLALPFPYDREDVERKNYLRDPTTFIEYLDDGIVLVVDIKKREAYYMKDGRVYGAQYWFVDANILE